MRLTQLRPFLISHGMMVLAACVVFSTGCGSPSAGEVPIGVWRAKLAKTEVLLQFEGGPVEGIYKQNSVNGGDRIREFGHWRIEGDKLYMLILATDIRGHPRVGKSIQHRIAFVGPNKIRISGPDRPDMVYGRAPAGVIVDVTP